MSHYDKDHMNGEGDVLSPPQAFETVEHYRIYRKRDGEFSPSGGVFSSLEEAQRQVDTIVGFNPEAVCKIKHRTVYRTEWKDI